MPVVRVADILAMSGVWRCETAKPILLHPILRLNVFNCLPLHIRRAVSAAALQRNYVVNHIARAWAFRLLGGWAGMLALEGCPGGLAAFYAPLGVTLDSRRCGRWWG
jgi:hypothetical protein